MDVGSQKREWRRRTSWRNKGGEESEGVMKGKRKEEGRDREGMEGAK